MGVGGVDTNDWCINCTCFNGVSLEGLDLLLLIKFAGKVMSSSSSVQVQLRLLIIMTL